MPDILGINSSFHEYVTAQWKLQCIWGYDRLYANRRVGRVQFIIMFRFIENRDFTSVALRGAQGKDHDSGL